MSNLSFQKARKQYVCNRCRQTINPGDMYYRIEMMYSPVQFRCQNCKPHRSELTSSEYLSWLYNFQDNLSNNYDLHDYDSISEIISEIEDQKEVLEDKLYSMPEQLQDGEAGQILQDRISSLEDTINELDYLEEPVWEEVIYVPESRDLVLDIPEDGWKVRIQGDKVWLCEYGEDFYMFCSDAIIEDIEEGDYSSLEKYKDNYYYEKSDYEDYLDSIENLADSIEEIISNIQE